MILQEWLAAGFFLAAGLDLAGILLSYRQGMRDNVCIGVCFPSTLFQLFCYYLAPAVLLLYTAFLERSSVGLTPGFNRLRTKPPGAGREGSNWARAARGAKEDAEVQLTWLGPNELRVLEAFGDTLLPGFLIDGKETADAAVEETVAMVRSRLFQSKQSKARNAIESISTKTESDRRGIPAGRSRPSRGSTQDQDPLPPRVEAYTRVLTRRCLTMHGRPGSDVGVAALLARAFETNISEEQRSGLGVLFWVLSTRAGAFVLTGRAVPFHAQSFAARHAVLKRWSVSRIGTLRQAFQGVKRLTCSLYFSAHPEAQHQFDQPDIWGMKAVATLVQDQDQDQASPDINPKTKTNPNWVDIRYDPQHHRFARDGNPNPPVSSGSSGEQYHHHATTSGGVGGVAARPRLWSGAKVKVSKPQTPRAAAAAAPDAPHKFFSRSRSKSNVNTNTAATPGAFSTSTSTSASASASTSTSPSGSASAASASASSEELPREFAVDVVIVGSGAGGGTAAGVLAARGLTVAVLEKGGLYGAQDFARFSEMEAYREMYEGQGVVATDNGGVVILAGSCVGGGTTINWAASFRTPRHVRKEWARKLGLKSFDLGGPFDEALDAVCARLEVNTENSHRGPGCPTPNVSLRLNQHQCSLWNGAAASGRVPRVVPTNTKGCVDCGSCLHGCAYGNKRSTHATWLQDGLDSGNIILVPNAKVDRVLIDGGRATGVEAMITPSRAGGKAAPLTVRARAVVVSGGAINTPAILLRSGLEHPMIGRHLCLHPVLVAGGIFPEDYDDDWNEDHDGYEGREGTGDGSRTFPGGYTAPAHQKQVKTKTKVKAKVDAEAEAAATTTIGLCPRVPGVGRGVMMGVYVQDLMGLDGGYGCVIEAPPNHPGLMGLVLPWNDALTHRTLVAMSRETSVSLCIGRDRSSNDNRVVLGPRGDPVIKYSLGKEDSQVLLQGRSEMLRMMRKAGASVLITAHEGAPWFCPRDGKEGDQDLEQYIEAIQSLGTTTNEAGLYSAHQMGSCRLSANPEDGPLRETGEAWECDGLFVADASVFPTSIGINPMITVEAVAYLVADQVATRLGKTAEDSAPRGESPPLQRRIKTLGKAVVAAMSRESSSTPDTEPTTATRTVPLSSSSKLVPDEGAGGNDHAAQGSDNAAMAWGVLPQCPLGVKGREKVAAGMGDDFGVDLGDLAW